MDCSPRDSIITSTALQATTGEKITGFVGVCRVYILDNIYNNIINFFFVCLITFVNSIAGIDWIFLLIVVIGITTVKAFQRN